MSKFNFNARERRGCRWLQAMAWVGLVSLVSACTAKPKEDETAMANIAGYNSTEDGIYQFYVDGYGGSGIRSYGGGGFVCCVLYPRKWRQGLTAEVRWTTSSGYPDGDPTQTWHEATVPIEQYDKSGTTMNVHFLPEGKVRILIWDGNPRSDGYKGPDYPEAPPGWSTRSIQNPIPAPVSPPQHGALR